MSNLDNILNSRDTTLPTKVRLVKAMFFPVVMYGCESWTVKKAERRIIDAFKLWCWRRLLRVPWTARKSNQSILKEISPGISLEGLMLKVKEESENVGIILNIQKTKVMASSPISSVQFSSVVQSCLTLCDPMNRSTPGLPVHHHLLEFTQTDVHRVHDAIQPSHPQSSPSPPAPNPSQHQSLFQ